MSVAPISNSKGEKSKKFQSLNINTVFQGSVSKPTTRSAPQKHGLQSLGKIPTARRAPANLPSLKAENFGNDPNVCLVPGSGGWVGKEDNNATKKEQNENKITENKPAPQSGFDLAKSWQVVPERPKPQSSFLSQRSPLFGQEFPSLGKDGIPKKPSESGPGPQQQHQSSTSNGNNLANTGAGTGTAGTANDVRYGPGPNLRPQTSGNWMHGGGAKGLSGSSQPAENEELVFKPEKPQFDVQTSGGGGGLKHPHMPIPTSVMPPKKLMANTDNRRSANHNSGIQQQQQQQRGNKPREAIFQTSIIDNEKLKRMDYFEANDDDWTRNDDNFDYNKKLTSDDEDEEPVAPWDHMNKRNIRGVPPPVTRPAMYDAKRDLISHATSPHIDDDEHQRRKKEEVLKNIERARKRREEEEKKYKTDSSSQNPDRYADHDNRGHYHQQQQQSHRNAPIPKKPLDQPRPSFGNFDVVVNGGGGSPKENSPPKLIPSSHGPQQNQRFKRHGGELQTFHAKVPSKEDYSPMGSPNDMKRNNDHHHYQRTQHEEDKSRMKESGDESSDSVSSSMDKKRNHNSGGGGYNNSNTVINEYGDQDFKSYHEEPHYDSNKDRRKDRKSADSIDSKRPNKPKPLMGGEGDKPKDRSNDHDRQDQRQQFDRQNKNNRSFGKQQHQQQPQQTPSMPPPPQQQEQQHQQQQHQHLGNSNIKHGNSGNKFGVNKGASNNTEGNVKNNSRPSKHNNKKYENQQYSDEESWDSKEFVQEGSALGGDHHRPQKYSKQNVDEKHVPSNRNDGDQRGNGWFMPRGQPSRRGRGNGSTRGGRAPPKYENDVKFERDHEENGSDGSLHEDANGYNNKFDDKFRGPDKGYKGGNIPNRIPKKRNEAEYGDKERKGVPNIKSHQHQEKMVEENVEEEGGNNHFNKHKEDPKRGKQFEPHSQGNKQFDPQSQNKSRGNSGPPPGGLSHQGGLKPNYERRQNKLPPRLAKQREQNRLAQKGRGDSWNTGESGNNEWRMSGDVENLSEMLEHMDDFKDKQIMHSDGVKQQQQQQLGGESHDPNLPVQTIIFENTNFKGSGGPANVASVDKGFRNDFKAESGGHGGGLPPFPVTGFFKAEDTADLKLDFNFESDMTGVEDKMDNANNKVLSSGHPSTEDLNLKIASVKKVWETLPSMSPITEGQSQNSLQQGRFQTNEDLAESTGEKMNSVHDQSGNMFEKQESNNSNVAKVRPQQQQQQQQHQQQQQLPNHQQPQQHHNVAQTEYERSLNRNNAVNYSNRGLVSAGLSALTSQSILANQPPSLYQAFQLDGRSVTNPLYPAYGIGGQSVLLHQSSGANPGDIFGAAAAAASTNQFRLQSAAAAAAAAAQYAVTSQHSSANTVLMSSALKQQQTQIGPIGTKAGNGQYQQSGLGNLPVSSSQMLIQYDTSGNPIYLPSSLQRAAAGQSGQTAFYQALAASSQANRQPPQFNMQGFPTNTQAGLQHLNQQSMQMRGNQGNPAPSKVGMNYPKQQQQQQDNSVYKNMRPAGESFAAAPPNNPPTPVSQQSGGSSTGGNNVNSAAAAVNPTSMKEGYNPTPIQRPQGDNSM